MMKEKTTVGELIEILKGFDSGMRVVLSGYEGGLSDTKGAKIVGIKLNQNTPSYYGPHEQTRDKKCDERVVYIDSLPNPLEDDW